MSTSKLVIGSRGSMLARAQSQWVKGLLKTRWKGLDISIKVISTKGDRILDVPLAKVGGKGLFVKEIEESLIDESCDIAVHSMKDVPDLLPDGLILGAELERDVPYDAFVSERYTSLDDLPESARVGTSSLRRQAQLLATRPDLDIVPLRGNVDTRLRKLSEGLDAVILAAAGLRRLGLGDRITSLLTPPEFVPATGQGVVVVECREEDDRVRELIAPLVHEDTRVAARTERAFLSRVGGGCQVPMGAFAVVDGDRVEAMAIIARPDGTTVLADRDEGTRSEAESIGQRMADRLLQAGGREILDELVEGD